MTQIEKNTNTAKPVPWQATTRLRYEESRERQLQKLCIDQGSPEAGTALVAYQRPIYSEGTKYPPYDRAYRLKILRSVVDTGLSGLPTPLDGDLKNYQTFRSGIGRTIREMQDCDVPEEDIGAMQKQLSAVQKKELPAFDIAIESLRQAQFQDRITAFQDLNTWLKDEKPSIWMQLDRYITNVDAQKVPGCSLLKLTGLVVSETLPDRVDPSMPQIGWEGTGMNGVSATFNPDRYLDFYLLKGPHEQVSIQNASPSATLL